MWRDECEQAMDMLKDVLMNAPALATIDYAEGAGEIILAVDTSGESWGAILQQTDRDSNRYPIRYESGMWTEAEKKYDSGKRECRALLRALKKL